MRPNRIAFSLAIPCVISTLLVACEDRLESRSATADPGTVAADPPPRALRQMTLAEAGRAAAASDAAASEGSGDLPNLMDGELASERAFQLTLPKADHPLWDRLRGTRIAIDESTQLYTAAHPDQVRALSGRTVTVRGYMLPLEAAARTRHFLISPYTPVCFFHPPAEPNEVIEVRTDKAVEAGYHLVEVTGRFALADNGEKGLFFTIADGRARVLEKVEG